MRIGFPRVITILMLLLLPVAVVAEAKQVVPGELQSGKKDRTSYDLALKQLDTSMRGRANLPSYEDMVDLFAGYRGQISVQEIGATLYHMYELVGPKPSAKYFAQRKINADTVAALAEKKKAEEVAAAKAAQEAAAQAKAQAQQHSVKTYTNSSGNKVQSPTYDRPAGATAKCKDGTYSSSANRRGTCSHHGGVAVWY